VALRRRAAALWLGDVAKNALSQAFGTAIAAALVYLGAVAGGLLKDVDATAVLRIAVATSVATFIWGLLAFLAIRVLAEESRRRVIAFSPEAARTNIDDEGEIPPVRD
jgi:hypothetical protein